MYMNFNYFIFRVVFSLPLIIITGLIADDSYCILVKFSMMGDLHYQMMTTALIA